MTHHVSSFIWAMSFACLIAPSRAVCLSVTGNVEKNNKNGQPVTGDCIDFGPPSPLPSPSPSPPTPPPPPPPPLSTSPPPLPLSPPPSVPDTFASFGPDTGGTSASITEQALSRPFLTVGSLAGIVALCGLSCLACLLRSRSTPRRKQPDSQRRKSSLKLRDGQEGAVPLAPTPSTRHPYVATSFLKFTRSLTIRKPAAIVSRSTDGDLADLINGEIVLDAKARTEVETLEAETLGLRAQVALRQLGVRDLKSLLHSHDSRGMHGLPRDQLMAASQSLVLRSPEAASAAIAAANKREVGPGATTDGGCRRRYRRRGGTSVFEPVGSVSTQLVLRRDLTPAALSFEHCLVGKRTGAHRSTT